MHDIRIPFTSRRHDDGLGDALKRAADKGEMTPHQLAVAMSWFFTAVVEQVCMGKTVTIPGFGQFGPWAYVSPKAKYKGYAPTCLPRFYASCGFKHEVMATAVPCNERNGIMENYRKNNTTPKAAGPGPERTFSALAKFREIILAQARRDRVEAS